MILADIFPVFCPRVLVQSSNPWNRHSSQSDIQYSKMWHGREDNKHEKDNHQLATQYPNLIPIPDKVYLDRRQSFRLFSDMAFERRPANTSIFSETSAFRSSPMTHGLPKFTPFLQPDKDQLPFQSPASGFFHMSQSFKQPSSITESLLRSPESTLQGSLFKRRANLVENLHCPRPKSHTSSHVIRSSPFCSSRAVGIYRKQSSATSQNKKLYTCPQCKYVTDRKNNLKRHISTMHQDSAKILECCGMVFRSKALLRDHVSLFHRAGYRCQYCGRNFCRKALLRRHLTVHSGQKDFTCPQCGYATSHKSNLERHRKIHDRKYSLNGEAFSDDTDSNDTSQYLHILSSPSTSPGSSPNGSSPKYTSSSGVRRPEEIVGSHTRTHRSAMPDRIRETHGIGETTMSTDPSIHTTLPVSMSHGAISPTYSTLQIQSLGLGGGMTFPLPISMTDEHTSGFFNPRIRSNSSPMERFSTKFLHESSGRKSSNRLFPNPYKCCDCLSVFPQQKLFNRHNCRSKNSAMLSPPISVIERKQKQAERKQEIEVDNKETMRMSVTENPCDISTAIKPATDDSVGGQTTNSLEVDIVNMDSSDINENFEQKHSYA